MLFDSGAVILSSVGDFFDVTSFIHLERRNISGDTKCTLPSSSSTRTPDGELEQSTGGEDARMGVVESVDVEWGDGVVVVEGWGFECLGVELDRFGVGDSTKEKSVGNMCVFRTERQSTARFKSFGREG